jgi:hypothetical protein
MELMTRNPSVMAGILTMAIAVAPRPAQPQGKHSGDWRDDLQLLAQSLVPDGRLTLQIPTSQDQSDCNKGGRHDHGEVGGLTKR